MNNKFARAFDFAVMFFIISGSLYFLYYLLQFNKLIYLLFSLIIYLISFFIRYYLFKVKNNNNRLSELGMFFISMIFLAYSLHIFKIDEQIVNYLPDKLLINSGLAFIFLVIINLLPKRKSGKLTVLVFLLFFVLIIFQDEINSVFNANSWLAPLIIGTPYIYLLSLLTGTYRPPTTSGSE